MINDTLHRKKQNTKTMATANYVYIRKQPESNFSSSIETTTNSG